MRCVALLMVIAGLVVGGAGCGEGSEGSGDGEEGGTTTEESRRSGDTGSATARAERTLSRLVIGGEERPLVEGSTITLALMDGNAVAGHAGVNRYNATPEVTEDGRLLWPSIITTKKAGPLELMEQEDAFLAALQRTDRMLIEKDQLVLENEEGSVRLVFR